MIVTGGGREGDNAVKVPEIGVQSKSGSGISQQFKAKSSREEKRKETFINYKKKVTEDVC